MTELPPGATFTPFHFAAHEEPVGYLTRDKACHACWWYYVLAQQNKEKVGDSIDDQFGVIEGNLWLNKNYEDLARSVCLMYGLDSPDDFMKYWDVVAAEASRCKLPIPKGEYMKRVRIVQ